MILHCEHALKSSEVGNVVIRSHSGDTDINIVAASLITDDAGRVLVDYNTGGNRKVLCLGHLELNDLEKSALIGIHSFTGNDYASSFFRRSKRGCWNIIKINPKFFNTFSQLGSTWLPSDQVQKELEEFVCLLYGSKRSKIRTVNEMRHRLYKQKFEVKNKVIDLSLLPPCLDSHRSWSTTYIYSAPCTDYI